MRWTSGSDGSPEAIVRRLRRQVALRLVAREAMRLGAGWAFAAGTVLLLARTLAGVGRVRLLIGLAGTLLPVLAVAIASGLRRRPGREALLAWLDVHGGCGGLLVAASEAEPGEWKHRLPRLDRPVVRWRMGSAAGLAALGLLYVGAGLALPARVEAPGAHELELGLEAAELEGQVRLLEELRLLEPERADTLLEAIGELRESGSGAEPGRTLEALDHLQSLLEREGARAAGEAAGAAERLTRAAALAETLAEGAAGPDPGFTAEAMAELERLTRDALREGEALGAQPADAGLRSALRQGPQLTPEQLRRLSGALRARRRDFERRMRRLEIAGILDARRLRRDRFWKRPHSDEALVAYLLEHADEDWPIDELLDQGLAAVAAGAGGGVGSGAVGRGRADAPLTAGPMTDEAGAAFQDEALPPAGRGSFEDSELIGLSATAPSPGAAAARVSRPGALDAAPAGRGSAVTRTLRPEHRGTVQRYFERP